jgi:hypothetical protein
MKKMDRFIHYPMLICDNKMTIPEHNRAVIEGMDHTDE